MLRIPQYLAEYRVLDYDRNVPPLPVPLLYFMEEREVWRGYLGGSVKLRRRAGIPPYFVMCAAHILPTLLARVTGAQTFLSAFA